MTQSTPAVGEPRFRDLLRQVADGNESASEEIVREYGPHIIRAVRRRMTQKFRDGYDSEDFAQAVWASFFGHLSMVERFKTEGELAGFLWKMASNKVIDVGRRRKSGRDAKVSDEVLPNVATDNRRGTTQPTPSQFAVANEKLNQLRDVNQLQDVIRLNESKTDKYRQVMSLLLSGVSRAEIAERTGISERHLRRVLNRIRNRESTAQ